MYENTLSVLFRYILLYCCFTCTICSTLTGQTNWHTFNAQPQKAKQEEQHSPELKKTQVSPGQPAEHPLPTSSDPEKAFRDSLRQIAASSADDSLSAATLNKLARTFLNKAPDSMEYYSQKVYEIASKNNYPTLEGLSLQKIGIARVQRGEPGTGKLYLQKAIRKFEDTGDRRNQIQGLHNLAACHYALSNLPEAQHTLVRIFDLTRDNEYSQHRMAPLILDGNIRYQIGDLEGALRQFQQGLELAENHSSYHTNVPAIIGNISAIYYPGLNQPDSALHYLKKAYSSEAISKDYKAQVNISANIANIMIEAKDDWEAGNQWLEKAWEIAQTRNLKVLYPRILKRLAEVHIHYQQYDQAATLLTRGIAIAREAEPKRLIDLLEVRIALDSASGNLAGILAHFREKNRIEDSLMGYKQQLEVQGLQQKIDLSDKEHEINLLEKEKDFQAKWRTTLSLALICVILLASGLIFFILRASRKNKALAETEKALRQSREALMESQLSQQKQEKEYLQNELNLKSRQLTDLATHLAFKKELLAEVQAQLKTLPAGKPQEELKEIHQKLSSHLQMDRQQKDLELYVEKSNQNFLHALEQQYPTITRNEKRLCAMIRLGMSNKEIAVLAGINPKSVEMSRYRLRKKLALDSDTNLQAFLDHLTPEVNTTIPPTSSVSLTEN